MGLLQRGDNLDLLRRMPSGSVQLVYVDPPFDTGEPRNARLRQVAHQSGVLAFADELGWSADVERRMAALDGSLGETIRALASLLGRGGRAAYVVMMAERLEQLRRVLAPSGAIYVHCDQNASHHLRLLLDAAFGRENFRNEVIWRRSSGHGNARRKFGSVHDTLLVYAASARTKWHEQFQPLSPRYVGTFFRHVEPGSGRRYRLQNTVNPNRNRPNLTYEWNGHVRTWKWSLERMRELDAQGRLHESRTGYPQLKQYLDESPGQRVPDVWDDIPSLQVTRRERCGFPTQKPLALLERIVLAHTDPGDLVLDPFSGSGTTAVAAETLGREWVAQDRSHLALALTHARVSELEPHKPVALDGVPVTVAQAQDLLRAERQEFRWWALALVGARPALREHLTGSHAEIDGLVPTPGGPRGVSVICDAADRQRFEALPAPERTRAIALTFGDGVRSDGAAGEIPIAEAMERGGACVAERVRAQLALESAAS